MNMAVPTAQMSPLDRQVAALAERYPGATVRPGGGNVIVTVPNVRLPEGWNMRVTTVYFVVPSGYPHARPDCFNVDDGIRLANGALPQNSLLQALDGVGQTLWFSWHLQRDWKPGRDTLLTWVGSILARFEARS